jgi:hypothetical protein
MQTRPAEAPVGWNLADFPVVRQARPASSRGNRPAWCSLSAQRSSSRDRNPRGLMNWWSYFGLASSFGAGAGAGALSSGLGMGFTADGTEGGFDVFAGSSGLHPLTSTTERPTPVASDSALNPCFFVTELLLQRISDRRDDLRSPKTKGHKPSVANRSGIDAIARRNVTDAYSSGLFPLVQLPPAFSLRNLNLQKRSSREV